MAHFKWKIIVGFLIILGANFRIFALEEIYIDGPPTILITNIMIYDGTGSKPFRGQVRIRGDQILDVQQGDQPQLSSDSQVIDGNGLDLAPGFIDTHSHHDEDLVIEPGASAAISQGITTIVRGMDGSASGLDETGFISLMIFSDELQSFSSTILIKFPDWSLIILP